VIDAKKYLVFWFAHPQQKHIMTLSPSNQSIDPDSISAELKRLIEGLLGSHLRSFSIDVSELGLALRGNCDSFHAKQLVQEIVSKSSSLRILSNDLVVNEPRACETATEHLDNSLMESRPIHIRDEAMATQVRFDTIFHPSDFSIASNIAFVHALRIALESKAMLQMMHVDGNFRADWDDFPSVLETLIRWKILPEGSERNAVAKLDLSVSKVIASSKDSVQACTEYLEINEVDLVVLSVHQREGMMRWLGSIVGERISQSSKQNTLFSPVGQSGFVSQVDGSVTLDHILIPVVKKPRAESAVEFVQDLISSLNLPTGTVTLLHVGPSETMPFVQYPQNDGWTWNRIRLPGDRTKSMSSSMKWLPSELWMPSTTR
jgi:hypothetical protein